MMIARQTDYIELQDIRTIPPRPEPVEGWGAQGRNKYSKIKNKDI